MTRDLTWTFDYRLDNKDFTSTDSNFRRVFSEMMWDLTWIWLGGEGLDLNGPSKTPDLMQSAVLPIKTWTRLCSHRVWPACVSCQLPDRWMIPSQLDLIQLSIRFHNFQTALLSFLFLPSFYLTSENCLSLYYLSCLATQLAVVLSDKHHAGGFNDSLGREGLKSYRWVMN